MLMLKYMKQFFIRKAIEVRYVELFVKSAIPATDCRDLQVSMIKQSA